MDETTVHHALYRVYADATEELVSEHPAFEESWTEGQRRTHAEPEHAFSLYADGQRVARFAHARLSPRLSVSNVEAFALIGEVS